MDDDTYIDVEDASTYLAAGFDSAYDAWFEASDTDKTKALESATRRMLLLPWKGLPATADQRLHHPIAGETTIPANLTYACAIIAAAILDTRDSEQEYMSQALTSERYGSLGVSRNTDHQAPHLLAGIPSLEAWRLIRPYLNELGSQQIVRVN